ncbi:MAG TPA: MutS family DNA mismatch repair protein, partial [Longimicrobiales bacterium]|nr:MutS family DNA mismatch repair protein [Longimicrobiales bacterium]
MADDMSPARNPAAAYEERAARFIAERDSLAGRSRWLSNGRIAAFALLIVLGLLVERDPSVLLIGATVAAAASFIALVVLHRRTRRREQWFADLASLNEEGLERLARRWERLPVRPPSRSIDGHAYAADLDLYGRASLSQILGPVATPFGSSALDDWLLEGAVPAVIAERSEAVRELAPLRDLRDTLALHGRAARAIRLRDIHRFLAWAESPGWASGRMWLVALAWLLPLATWLLAIAHLLGMIDRSLWLIPLLATFAAYVTIGARARRVFDDAFGREPLFTYYPDMMRAVAAETFSSPLLQSLSWRLSRDGVPADRQLQSLQRLMHRADLRMSSMHLPVFLLTMWDVHVLLSLEQWQRRAGVAVRDWLAALGEVEALGSLATLAHDQPEWTFPDIAGHGEDAVLEAESLGHPLIGDEARVHNDVRVGPAGTFLLVTGSNMSGKSTLLRALGLNVVLAQAGAPVCAARMRMPPLEVHTSIRVQDSLARGVSYFMAELERLKQIVDAAHRVRDHDTATLLFLLDEILHGTNTAERRIAATRVIRHLVDTGAIGAATTHDLELAEERALSSAARLVHFSEMFDDVDGASTLRFDYQLREGLATSTNALALM